MGVLDKAQEYSFSTYKHVNIHCNFGGIMDIIRFFEGVAANSHPHVNLEILLENFPAEIKNAFLNNDIETLRLLISDTDCLANESHVAYIQL